MHTVIYSHPDCLGHDPGPAHPESPDRLRVILNELKNSPLGDKLAFHETVPGSNEQILLAHTPTYLQFVRDSSPVEGKESLDGDTVMSPGSLRAVLQGVGAACQAVDDLMNGHAQNVFCATRPPGHHSTPGKAMGFCIFNNAAIAALYAQQQYGLERVAIVDFDVHHGNGTQAIMSGRTGVLYISTHQSPLYPGTGSTAENIPGNIVNLPLPSGTLGDVYRPVFEQHVLTELAAFKPQLLVVSAGFDAHYKDPLASLALDEEDYHWLGVQLKAAADKYCKGKIMAVLEGGYNLDVLGTSVASFIEGLSG